MSSFEVTLSLKRNIQCPKLPCTPCTPSEKRENKICKTTVKIEQNIEGFLRIYLYAYRLKLILPTSYLHEDWFDDLTLRTFISLEGYDLSCSLYILYKMLFVSQKSALSTVCILSKNGKTLQYLSTVCILSKNGKTLQYSKVILSTVCILSKNGKTLQYSKVILRILTIFSLPRLESTISPQQLSPGVTSLRSRGRCACYQTPPPSLRPGLV